MVKIAITIPQVNMTDGEDVEVQMILINVYFQPLKWGHLKARHIQVSLDYLQLVHCFNLVQV